MKLDYIVPEDHVEARKLLKKKMIETSYSITSTSSDIGRSSESSSVTKNKNDSLSIGDENIKIPILNTANEIDKDGIQHDKEKRFEDIPKEETMDTKTATFGPKKMTEVRTQQSLEGYLKMEEGDTQLSFEEKIQSDINEMKIMISSLSLTKGALNPKEIEFKGGVVAESLKNVKNLLEIDHQDILIEGMENGYKVTCIPCQQYREAHSKVLKVTTSSSTWATGFFYDKEKSDLLISGGNQTWYRFKKSMIEHLSCDAKRSAGQAHFQSSKFQLKQRKKENALVKINTNVVSAAIHICKSKSSALSFESQIALLSFCGAEVGNICHGRNNFNEIVHAAYEYIIIQTKDYLHTPLKSTGLPPHVSVAVDKSTPHRDTNQAIVLIFPVEGKRVALPIDAPLVYKTVGKSITGGAGKDLAAQIMEVLSTKVGFSEADFHFVRAIHADGQYQAQTFQSEILRLIGSTGIEAGEFFLMPWDPSHWLDRVMEYMRENCDESSKYLKRLIKRTNKLYKMFGHGRGHREYKGLAESLGLPALETVTFSTTRFFSSAYEQWSRIYQSYFLLIDTYKTFRQTDDEEDETKHEVRGQDFAIDLCGTLDVFHPVVVLMLRSQAVNQQPWKVSVWYSKVIKRLTEIYNHLDGVILGDQPSVDLLPKLAENWKDLTAETGKYDCGKFREHDLTPGWIIVEEKSIEESNEKIKKMYTWSSRSPDECLKDLQNIVLTLKESLEKKFAVAVSAEVKLLSKVFDFETAITLLSKYRLNSMQNQLEVSQENRTHWETFGRIEFQSFFKDVCKLPHVSEYSSQNPDLHLLPHASDIIFNRLKTTLRNIVWRNLGEISASLFHGVDNEPIEVFKTSKITSFEEREENEFSLDKIFQFKMEDGSIVKGKLNEEFLISSFYTNSEIYDSFGKEMCICLDVALATSGCEAIVEGFYSVVNVHKKNGGQNNENLLRRSIVDWSLPHPVSCPKTMQHIAELYVLGNKELGIKKHRPFYFHDSRGRAKENYTVGKVVDRLMKEKPRCPHLVKLDN